MTVKQLPTRSELFGIPLDKLTQSELITRIIDMSQHDKSIVAYANIKTMNLAYEEAWYAEFLNLAELVYCDGYGVVLGARLLGRSIRPEHRTTCPDWLETLAGACAENGRSLFILAGCEQTAEIAQKRLTTRYPNLKLGVHDGYFEKRGSDNEAVIQKINSFEPDILVVGFGTPLQEKWIEQNYQHIKTHVFLPVGACVDYYTGLRSRGPAWLTNNGFEWLCRLLTEPKRLWHRYMIGIPLFIFRLFRVRFWPRRRLITHPKKLHVQSRPRSYAEQDN